MHPQRTAGQGSSTDGVVVIGTDGSVRLFDPGAETLFGYDADDVIGQPVTMLMREEDRELHRAGLNRYVAGGEAHILGNDIEVVARRADGEEFSLGLRVTEARFGDETVFVGAVKDLDRVRREVANVRRTEGALRDSLSIQQATFDATDEGLALIDRDGMVMTVNRPFIEMWRLDPLGVVGWGEILRMPEITDQLEDPDAYTAMLDGLSETPIQRHEETLHLEDGRVFEMRSTPRLIDGKPEGRLYRFRDITDRLKAEAALARSQEQLIQVQKMDAVGQLAGGIAHDFNNLLTVISSYAQLVRSGRRKGEQAVEAFDEILKASDRATQLTRQLLAFSRKQFHEPKVLDLNAIVMDMLRMLRRIVGEDIEVDIGLADDLDSVLADPSQIDQVLMNLAVNARDAMPDGGHLLIETENVTLTREYTDGQTEIQPGPFVSLAVSDTGTGMDAETIKRIFEPFFTTKEVGRGTGLGLSTVYGIVHQSGGTVTAYSELGRGSTFRVYLPSANRDAAKDASTIEGDVVGGNEHILVIEDADAVRRLTCTVLESFGYEVTTAATPREGLRTFRETPERFAMVLTDIVMPKMSGPKLVEKMRALRPNLPVLFVSGYTEAAIEKNRLLEIDAPFMPKPFRPEELARTVRRVLDEASSAANHDE